VASIASGLQAGQVVITEGGDQLRDGSRVVLPGERAQRPQRQKKKGFFAWLGSLFGGKPDATGDGDRGASNRAGSQSSRGGPAPGAGRMAAVETALGLDAEQKTKAEEIFAEARAEATAQAGDEPEARRAAMRAANDKAFSRLEPILRPDQKARLPAAKAAMQRRRGSGGEGPGGG
jgi:hypothetical protein